MAMFVYDAIQASARTYLHCSLIFDCCHAAIDITSLRRLHMLDISLIFRATPLQMAHYARRLPRHAT